MESELKDFDDGSTKDDRPLLNPDSTSRPVSSESLEELEDKFAAFVRNDVYGPMGRGETPWPEKFLLGVAFVTLVPIRVVVALIMLFIYYLIFRVCTLFSAPNREDEQEDYAHMGGWRRAVIVQSGKFLSRVMLFNLGFYCIRETHRESDTDKN